MSIKTKIIPLFEFLRKTIVLLVFVFICFATDAQKDTIQFELKGVGIISTGNYSPFWLQSQHYGQNSASSSSSNLHIGISKDYGLKSRLFDYGFKANLLCQTDNQKPNIYFHELFAKLRFSVVDLAIGPREEHYGNQDSTLSCGGLLFSKNSRPMPKVSIGIEQFTAIPFTLRLLEIKGGLSHGWFTDNIYTTGLLLHHKYLYARIGGKLPFHFQYGIDHAAQWGGYEPIYGLQPSSIKNYKQIFLGRSGGSSGEAINALGNHIISQSLRLDAAISNYRIAGYWQNISEDGPIRFIGNTMNAPDGLWGISIRNNKFPFVKGIVYEYLQTSDQSGPYHDKDGMVYGGADSYFQNYVYRNGWSYYSRIIGTPFISSAIYNTNGNVATENSRVIVHHVGIEGDVLGYQYKALTSFSKNYGNYGNPKNIANTSTYLEFNKKIPELYNLELGASVGADFGKLYGNSIGLLISIKKRGTLFSY